MKKIFTEFIVEALLFFGIFFLTLQVDLVTNCRNWCGKFPMMDFTK